MKILDKNLFVELDSNLKGTAKSSKGKEAKAAGSSTSVSDRVDISSTSREIQQARDIIDGIEDVRGEKVAALKQSIEDGSYNVGGDTIASNIIESAFIDVLL